MKMTSAFSLAALHQKFYNNPVYLIEKFNFSKFFINSFSSWEFKVFRGGNTFK